MIDEDLHFRFNKLVPMPNILACTLRSPDLIVTPEELRQYKEDHKLCGPSTYYEQEGLLYWRDIYGPIVESRCTAECAAKLLQKYGVATYEDFAEKYWGPSYDITSAEEDAQSYSFHSNGNIAYPFMKVMAQTCPQGHWQWNVSELFDTETLIIEIKDGAIFLEEHWIQRVDPEHDERDFKTLDSLIWKHAKLWNGADGPQRALAAAQRLKVGDPGVRWLSVHERSCTTSTLC